MSILAQSQPSRQGYVSAVTVLGAGIVPSAAGEVQVSFFTLASITGFRLIRGGGMWLNCQFRYNKPAGMVYHLEAACAFDHLACSTGGVYVRSCSCPDGLHRVGQKGAMRSCKHMIALAARIAASAGVSAGSRLVASVQLPPAADVFAAPEAAPAEETIHDRWLKQYEAEKRSEAEEIACELQAERDEVKRCGSRYE